MHGTTAFDVEEDVSTRPKGIHGGEDQRGAGWCSRRDRDTPEPDVDCLVSESEKGLGQGAATGAQASNEQDARPQHKNEEDVLRRNDSDRESDYRDDGEEYASWGRTHSRGSKWVLA